VTIQPWSIRILTESRRHAQKGCALFNFEGERIADVWVLGDLKNLEDQLKRNET